MARCCSGCFSDVVISAQINKASLVNKCAFCDANKVNCIDPKLLGVELDVFLESLDEAATGFLLVDILNDYYGIFSGVVKNKEALTAAIFGTAVAGKRYKFKFPIDGYLDAWNDFKEELKHRNRFFPKTSIYSSIFVESSSSSVRTIFFQILEQLTVPFYEGESLFRARISENNLGAADMGVPPPTLAGGGRANPLGIPYLYLAENTKTCVAEVRPSNSSIIHISSFRSRREMSLLDLTNPRLLSSVASFESDQFELVLSLLALLEKLSFELSKPILPDKSHIEYIPTQFICEFLKTVGGIDGIVFTSSFGFGKNYVFYSPDDFEVDAPVRHRVKSTTHETEAC